MVLSSLGGSIFAEHECFRPSERGALALALAPDNSLASFGPKGSSLWPFPPRNNAAAKPWAHTVGALREIVLEGSLVSPVMLDEPCTQKTLVFLARVADLIYPAPSDIKTQREKQHTIALRSASFWRHGKDRMLIGYVRISKSDGSQTLDLQRDALSEAGVDPCRIYEDLASGRKDDRPGLASCLKALQPGNILVVWNLRQS